MKILPSRLAWRLWDVFETSLTYKDIRKGSFVFTPSEQRPSLWHLWDIHNVQKKSERHPLFLQEMGTRLCFDADDSWGVKYYKTKKCTRFVWLLSQFFIFFSIWFSYFWCDFLYLFEKCTWFLWEIYHDYDSKN